MAIRIPTTDQSKIFLGSQKIGAVYVGANKVWPDAPTTPEIVIGGQTWMLRNISFDDGLGGIYPPNGNMANVPDYGYLYTYDAAVRIAALYPGWRMPTLADRSVLINNFTSQVGGRMKDRTGFWNTPNMLYSTDLGFAARASGSRSNLGVYSDFGAFSYLWTTTPSGTWRYCMALYNDSEGLFQFTFNPLAANSLRLIKI